MVPAGQLLRSTITWALIVFNAFTTRVPGRCWICSAKESVLLTNKRRGHALGAVQRVGDVDEYVARQMLLPAASNAAMDPAPFVAGMALVTEALSYELGLATHLRGQRPLRRP